ncbi:MAG: 2-hydroxyacyl-CoA dehydratase [Dehalococcoidia bacterium]|nr:2-hydroxyacyl-CoA dehydratase [Dehalococcoidia bacterium]
MDSLKKFQDVIERRHQYAREWKAKTGKKIVGYMCTYFPEEITYAAGMLPVRIICNQKASSNVDVHMSPHRWCPFSCGCLSEGLEGIYDYLDGMELALGCFHNLQTFSSWNKEVPTDYSHYVYLPAHIQSRNAGKCLSAELLELKQNMENMANTTISDADLRHTISIYNENRRLLRDIYDLRKKEPPLISGQEAMEMVLSSQLMDKAEHNTLLRQAFEEITANGSRLDSNPRLMIIGSGANDLDLVTAIESWGANIVIDEHCIGSRYFWNEVEPGKDLLAALSNRYINRPPCPGKDFPERRRLDHLFGLVDNFNVQGAIILLQKYCEPHAYDIPIIETRLSEINVPSIVLEMSIPPALGQIQNRVESLLDIIKGL